MAALAVQLAFTAAGNAIGFGIPALGLTGAGVGSLVGSVAASYLFPPPDVKNFGPRLSDLSITSSSYGRMRPLVYGTAPVSGDIIDASDKYETSHTETEEGGKGGGQEVSYTTYTYSIDLAVALCEGPISGVLQVFANESLIYDATPGSSFLKPSWLQIKVYTGTETQESDPTLEAIHGAGNVPGYRGQAYVVFTRFQLEQFGNRIPTFRFIVVGQGTNVVNETITDISPDAGTAIGPLYLQSTGLIYAGVSQGSYDERAIVALDPVSKSIVWAMDGRSNQSGWGIRLHDVQPPQECGDGTNTYIVSVGRNSTGGTKRRLFFINAKTGVPTRIVDVESSVDAVMRLLSLFKDKLSFLHPGGGVSANVRMHTFSTSWTDTHSAVNDPSGWDWNGNFVWAVKQGDGATPYIAAVALVNGSDNGIAVWEGYYRSSTSAYTPNYVVHDFGSVLDSIYQIKYDSVRECFWALADTVTTGYAVVIKIPEDGSDTTSYNWNTLYGMTSVIQTGTEMFGDEFQNGYLWIEDSVGDLWRWDIVNLTAPVEYAATSIDRTMTYVPATDAMWGATSDDLVEYQFDRLQSNTVTLSSIVDDLLDRVDVASADYDTTDLDAVAVRGYVVSNMMPARNALDPLRKAFLFDHADTGDVIEFRQLGQTLSKSLTVDDIGAHAYGDAAPALIEIDRAQESDLPKEMSVNYMDIGANYEVGHQRARIISGRSSQSIAIELPVVFTHQEAAQKAEILLHLSRIERETYALQAMPKHCDLIPSDVISVNDDIDDYRLRIVEKMNERGVLKLRGVRDVPEVLTSSAQGAEITGRDISIAANGIMQFDLLDLPALRDADMAAGFYAAGYSYTPGWTGGVIFRSSDQATWAESVTITSSNTAGRVWNKPSDSVAERWDDTNSLSISIFNGELESKTRAEITLGRVNAAAYGDTGRWEIIQFTDATLGSDGWYTVSGLLRGRLGTDANVNNHKVGDLFVLLDTNTLRRIEAEQSEIGSTFYYRGVTLGRSLYDTTNIEKSHDHIGSGLLCYSPAHFRYYKEADLDVVFNWDERTRQIWANFYSGVSSDPGDYEIDVLDGSTVVRTITVSAETTTYSRTDQETDFGASTTDTIDVRLYQVNSTGRGHYAELSVTLG